MFAGLSLFYQDVVIGRPGARCDALEARRLIVCIPGARRCYQRTRLVNLGCKICVHNLRDCAKMGEMRWTYDCLLHTIHSLLHASHVTTPTSSVATNDCSGKHAVFSGTQSSGPGPAGALGPL